MPDTATLSHLDDPKTADLMEGVNEARILLASDAHRRELAELADISRRFLEMQERYNLLQASIDARNAVYGKAEAALHAHLATKHAQPAARAAQPAPLPVAVEPDLPNWPHVEPDILDGSVMEVGDKRYVATDGIWVEDA